MKSTQFMNNWFKDTEGFIEFRLIGKKGKTKIYFKKLYEITDEFLAALNEKARKEELNVYYGVCTRKSGEGTESNTSEVPGLWVDIDPKHASYEKAIEKVNSLATPPSVIISSGNGIHAYFKFSKPYKISNEDDLKKLKGLSIRLHKHLAADSTVDLSRLLRVPDSLNVKDKSNIAECKVVEFSGVVYEVNEFEYLPQVDIDFNDRDITIEYVQPVTLESLRVTTDIKKLVMEGVEKGLRSEQIFRVVCSMLKHGHSNEEIAFVLTNPNWGISEKVLEKASQHQLSYIQNAISKALQRIEASEPTNSVSRPQKNTVGIIEKDRCYYHGEKRLSNFVIDLKERIVLGHEELLRGIIKISNGYSFPVFLSHKSLISKRDFLDDIKNTQVSWLGTDKDIQYLREHLTSKAVIEKRGVNKIGLHDDLFVTASEVWNKNGVVDSSSVIYVSKFIQNPIEMERQINIPYSKDWQGLARNALPLLEKINEPQVIYPLIGWHMLCPIAPLARGAMDGGFPQLMIWGTKGSGKTSTAQTFGKMFGNGEVRSCSRPPFSIMREADTLNAIPLYLDEYRPNQMNKGDLAGLRNVALLAYKATLDARGLKDQSTVDYRYTAPITWIGETPFTEPNLLERVVMAKLSPQVLQSNPQYKNWYREFNQLNLSLFLGGYIQWLLQRESQGELNLRKRFNDMVKRVENKHTLPERIILNIASILVGLTLFEELAQELNVNIETIPYNSIIEYQVEHLAGEEAKGSLDRLMEHTATLVQKEILRAGKDYLYNPVTGELALATTVWLASLRKFCREYDYMSDMPTDTQTRNFLKENQESHGYIKVVGGERRTIGKQVRCTIIDIILLEEQLGIPQDTWKDILATV